MASLSTKRNTPQEIVSEGLVAVPTGSTALVSVDAFIFQISVSNTTGGSLTFLVTDKNSTGAITLVPTVPIPANTIIIMSWPEGVKMNGGIQWQAGGSGLTAEVLAFQHV